MNEPTIESHTYLKTVFMYIGLMLLCVLVLYIMYDNEINGL